MLCSSGRQAGRTAEITFLMLPGLETGQSLNWILECNDKTTVFTVEVFIQAEVQILKLACWVFCYELWWEKKQPMFTCTSMCVFSYSLICTVTTFLAPTPLRLYLVRHNNLRRHKIMWSWRLWNVVWVKRTIVLGPLSAVWLTCMFTLREQYVIDLCVCVCVVLDFSVANPSAGLGGPNGDIFSADITSAERPLIRSQSFHNSPGKWPLGPSAPFCGRKAKRPRIVYCFSTLRNTLSHLAKNTSKWSFTSSLTSLRALRAGS